MKSPNLKVSLAALIMLSAAFAAPQAVQAHCDSLDGLVVNAGRAALTEGDVNLVLIWVQKDDEAQIKQAFEKTFAVRKLSAEARELADMYFFEILRTRNDCSAGSTTPDHDNHSRQPREERSIRWTHPGVQPTLE